MHATVKDNANNLQTRFERWCFRSDIGNRPRDKGLRAHTPTYRLDFSFDVIDISCVDQTVWQSRLRLQDLSTRGSHNGGRGELSGYSENGAYSVACAWVRVGANTTDHPPTFRPRVDDLYAGNHS
jgi:hypothetical protein